METIGVIRRRITASPSCRSGRGTSGLNFLSALPRWPAFTAKDQQRTVFRGTPQAKRYDNLAQLEAMDAYFAWRRGAEGREFGKHGGNTNSSPLGLR